MTPLVYLGPSEALETHASSDIDSEEVDAKLYQFVVDLDVVALKGSVPNEWQEDFKQVRLSAPCLDQLTPVNSQHHCTASMLLCTMPCPCRLWADMAAYT